MSEPNNWASVLIHLGALLYILGFLVRDEFLMNAIGKKVVWEGVVSSVWFSPDKNTLNFLLYVNEFDSFSASFPYSSGDTLVYLLKKGDKLKVSGTLVDKFISIGINNLHIDGESIYRV